MTAKNFYSVNFVGCVFVSVMVWLLWADGNHLVELWLENKLEVQATCVGGGKKNRSAYDR